MKRLIGVVIGCMICYIIYAQTSIKHLTSLLNSTQNQQENFLRKKGFAREADEKILYSKTTKKKRDTSFCSYQFIADANTAELIYKTTSQKEFRTLEEQLKAFCPNSSATNLYQKENLVFGSAIQQIDSITTFYTIHISSKAIPKLKDVVYAEDLLSLDSHEYLAAVFGRQYVKKDSFYFTPVEGRPCTVLFPNTNHQAIFLWEDEKNFRDIAFIIIGDQSANENTNLKAVMLSSWISEQGIYCGMSLRDVQNINKQPVSFYNWHTSLAGMMAPQNKGELNFGKLKLIFSCLNCGFIYVDHSKELSLSTTALKEDQKVYVSSYVLMPDEKARIVKQGY